MNKKLNKMINDFTDNYSELFVETFLIKYMADFDMKNYPEVLAIVYQTLISKINKKMVNKLKELGYPKSVYQKYQNKKED